MLDVITIVSETTPKRYVAECRRSLEAALKHATFSVRLIECAGVPGHIGQAMHNSLEHSTANYVAWVDDDDFVLPNAFSCLQWHWEGWPSAICAREVRLLANGRLIPQHARHHFTVFHRDVVAQVPLTDLPSRTNLALLNALQGQPVVDELSWVYFYRLRRSEGMKLRGRPRNAYEAGL